MAAVNTGTGSSLAAGAAASSDHTVVLARPKASRVETHSISGAQRSEMSGVREVFMASVYAKKNCHPCRTGGSFRP